MRVARGDASSPRPSPRAQGRATRARTCHPGRARWDIRRQARWHAQNEVMGVVFPCVLHCFARTFSASRRRENQQYGLNKYSAALCTSANSAFNFDVNHLNAESAETQRTAEKKKCAHCSRPDGKRRHHLVAAKGRAKVTVCVLSAGAQTVRDCSRTVRLLSEKQRARMHATASLQTQHCFRLVNNYNCTIAGVAYPTRPISEEYSLSSRDLVSPEPACLSTHLTPETEF